jgi:hypothetical protein
MISIRGERNISLPMFGELTEEAFIADGSHATEHLNGIFANTVTSGRRLLCLNSSH